MEGVPRQCRPPRARQLHCTDALLCSQLTSKKKTLSSFPLPIFLCKFAWASSHISLTWWCKHRSQCKRHEQADSRDKESSLLPFDGSANLCWLRHSSKLPAPAFPLATGGGGLDQALCRHYFGPLWPGQGFLAALNPANSWDHVEGWKCTVQSTGWRHRKGGIKFFVRLLIVPREHNHLYTVSMAIWKMFRFKHLLQNHTISNATPLDETRDTAHRLSV